MRVGYSAYLNETEFVLSSRVDVEVEIVPVVVLELLVSELGPRHVVAVRVRHLEAVRVAVRLLHERVSVKRTNDVQLLLSITGVCETYQRCTVTPLNNRCL